MNYTFQCFKWLTAVVLVLLYNTLQAQLYFQQTANYKIDVALDDNKHELNGTVTITYLNHSPADLDFIYVHLWPNAYKNNQTALCKELVTQGNKQLYFAPDSLRGFIDKLQFESNHQKLKLEIDSTYEDIAKLQLTEPLKAGDSIIITTPFRVKIPSASFSRMGRGKDFYAITQWYPKVAVYDAQGWHAMPYLDQGEFYSDFGTYTVTVTLPADYVVGATGNLTTTSEIKWLDNKAHATAANPNAATNNHNKKTITFEATRVHDFAWFASKQFIVVKDSVLINNKWVTTWCLHNESEKKYWKNATSYIHDALRFYSNEIGAYPYQQITVCSGTVMAGSGMEYPQITIVGEAYSDHQLETTIVHEIGHNWFQGILATNERNEPWLDEGINSFYEMEYFLQKYPHQNITEFDAIGKPIANLLGNKFLNAHSYKFNQYQSSARTWSNQPNNLQANCYTQSNYGNIIYAKSAVALAYLKKYLGNDLFKQCMQQYFLRWQFMHPNTYEFKNVIEDVSQQNVDWFFDEIIATNCLVDYKIKKVSQRPPYTIKIKNKTGLCAPVFMDVNYGNHQEQICLNGFKKTAIIPLQSKPVSIAIDSLNMMMDSYYANNYYNSKQLFKKQTLGLRFYSSYDAKKSLLYYIPIAGWNQYNHWMPGVLIHNQGLVSKRLEFAIMPLYSFATNNLNGSFMFQYKQAYNQQWQFIAKIKGMQYNFGSTYFNATEQLQQFRFKKFQPTLIVQHRSDVLSKLLHQFSATAYFINRNDVFGNGTVPAVNSENFYYQQLNYEIKNNSTFDPWQAGLTLENGKNYLKAFAHAQYNFSYKRRQRGITVNAFAGSFIYNDSEIQNVNLRMSGFSGMQDYLFNYTYLGRSENEGILSKQFIANDGGFKINTAVGQTNKWLTSINFQVTIPGLPLMLYMDAGTYYNAANAYEGSEAFMYNGGICLWLIRDVIELYAPLFYSADIKKNLTANNINTFGEKIRLQLHFDLLNPLKLQRQFFN